MILGSLSPIWNSGGPPTGTSDDSRSRLGGSESVAATTMLPERHSSELVEEPLAYIQGATDHSGAQFEQLSPKSLGQASRPVKDPRSLPGRRRTKDSISTTRHTPSRSR
jgi:hypothetical protein